LHVVDKLLPHDSTTKLKYPVWPWHHNWSNLYQMFVIQKCSVATSRGNLQWHFTWSWSSL